MPTAIDCGEHCQNRACYVHCDPASCPRGPRCTNRPVPSWAAPGAPHLLSGTGPQHRSVRVEKEQAAASGTQASSSRQPAQHHAALAYRESTTGLLGTSQPPATLAAHMLTRAGRLCRGFQYLPNPRMEAFQTDHTGWGVRACDPILRGRFIIEYAGGPPSRHRRYCTLRRASDLGALGRDLGPGTARQSTPAGRCACSPISRARLPVDHARGVYRRAACPAAGAPCHPRTRKASLNCCSLPASVCRRGDQHAGERRAHGGSSGRRRARLLRHGASARTGHRRAQQGGQQLGLQREF